MEKLVYPYEKTLGIITLILGAVVWLGLIAGTFGGALIGLAAGFDKNAAVVASLSRLGFGSIEVGTVTDRPQPGNERPRMFRLPADRALINRLGFNNEGAAAAACKARNSPRRHRARGSARMIPGP